MRPLVALVLAAASLLVTPAAASALSCPAGGALAELHASDAAFIGQGIERRGNHVMMSVVEAFKGVAAGQTVEVIYADGFPMLPPGTESTQVFTGQVVVLASILEGRLFTTVCRAPGMTPDVLRAAAAAAGQGLRCHPPPRIVWAVPTVTGRLLSLRVVVADEQRRTNTVRVEWEQFLGMRQNPVTTTRVPRSRTVLLRHRYRRSGDVQVRVTVTGPAMLPSSLCLTPFGSSRTLPVRIPGSRLGPRESA